LLGEINYQIVFNEASIESIQYYINIKDCCAQKQREALTADIKKGVDDIYSYQNSVDGVPLTKILRTG
jgi:hypothetical protein